MPDEMKQERNEPIPALCQNNDDNHSWVLAATIPQPPFLIVVWGCPCGQFKTAAVRLNIEAGPQILVPTGQIKLGG